MQRILSASKDGYITNRIINNTFRATDSNVGQAGTLDLFKLYGESTLGGDAATAKITIVQSGASVPGNLAGTDGFVLVDALGNSKEYIFNSVSGGTATGVNTADGIVIQIYGMSSNQVIAQEVVKAINSASGHGSSGLDTMSAVRSDNNILLTQKTSGGAGNTIINPGSTPEPEFISYQNFDGGVDPSTNLIELSRLLLKFDLTPVRNMQSKGLIDVASDSFKAELVLHDVYGGQTTPNNFTAVVFPLARDFDEGTGMDVAAYSHVGATNYITASIKNGVVTEWVHRGAMKSGSINQTNIDVITSGTISGQSSAIPLCGQQHFEKGDEDLRVDLTNFVSASVKNLATNRGFLVALSGSHQTDNKSYFVKRFASRNTSNTNLRPKLVIKYDDSIIDNHGNFIFDHTGSIYLNNYSRTTLTNIKNPNNTDLSPTGAMILKIRSGSFSKNFPVSQAVLSHPETYGPRITGLYSASFALSSYETLIKQTLKEKDKIEFDAIWSSPDQTVTFLSSSLTVKRNERTSLNFRERRLLATTLNLKDRYTASDFTRIRLFIENTDREVIFSKGPIEKVSEIFEQVYYSVKDTVTGVVVIPFDTANNSTKLSTDSVGMYYDFYMSSLPRGRAYIFEYLVIQGGVNTYITDAASKFVIE